MIFISNRQFDSVVKWMASDKLGMIPEQPIRRELSEHPQMVFPEAFTCGAQLSRLRPTAAGDPDHKAATRELTDSFLSRTHFFQSHPPHTSLFRQQWNSSRRSSPDDSEEDDAEVEDENDDAVDEEGETNLEKIVTVAKLGDTNKNQRYGVNFSCRDMKYILPLGIKEGNLAQNDNESIDVNNRSCEMRNASSSEVYFSGYPNRGDIPCSSGQNDITTMQNSNCGFSGRKDGMYPSETGESLRAIFSDPLTGKLMEDAMILPCGHSYGSSGIQQILRMKACHNCTQPVSEDSIAPNLSLRLAVQAFKREEEFQVNNWSKRRRERYEQGCKGDFGDSTSMDQQKRKRIQFPFAVTDRVIIKGNKRTPQRFFGREAIVTAQCLNGWYVVKTVDNAESVKVQYRSLAKVTPNSTSKSTANTTILNWM